MPEAVSNQQTPIPVRLRIGLRIDLAEGHGRIDVAALILDPQIQLEVGPIRRHRIEHLLKVRSQAHKQKRI